MKDQTGVILIHILLYLQSSQHQQNTYHQTGYCSDILQLSILFTQIKKIYIQIIAWTQVIILHIQQFYQGSIVLPKCVHSSLARGEFKDVIVCYVWELIHWWDSILLPQRRQGTAHHTYELNYWLEQTTHNLWSHQYSINLRWMIRLLCRIIHSINPFTVVWMSVGVDALLMVKLSLFGLIYEEVIELY